MDSRQGQPISDLNDAVYVKWQEAFNPECSSATASLQHTTNQEEIIQTLSPYYIQYLPHLVPLIITEDMGCAGCDPGYFELSVLFKGIRA